MNRRAMIKPHPARFALLAVAPFLLMLAACGPAPAPELKGTNFHGASIGGSFTLTGWVSQPLQVCGPIQTSAVTRCDIS